MHKSPIIFLDGDKKPQQLHFDVSYLFCTITTSLQESATPMPPGDNNAN